MSQNKKIALFIFFTTVIYSLIVFNGSIDSFVPEHIVTISEIIERSNIPNNSNVDFPGFYALGAIISLLCGISSNCLMFYPIQLVPYFVVSYALLYKLSGNCVLASLVTFLGMISGTTGTFRVFLWPHGLGELLSYVIILLVLYLLKDTNFKKCEITFLLILVGSSLIFISYNYTGMTLILLTIIIFSIIFINYFNNYGQKTNINLNKRVTNQLYGILLVYTIVEFGLSNFFYKSMIPVLKRSLYLDISSMDKFLVSYFYVDTSDSQLQNLFIVFPKIISIISSFKYFLLIVSIFLFLYLFFKKLCGNEPINSYDILLISVILMNLLYSLMRVLIGGIPIAQLYLPGIFCTLWIYRFSRRFKYWSICVVVLLLILIPSYTYINYSYNLDNHDQSKYAYIEMPSKWLFEYKTDHIAVSDEFTRNLFILYESNKLLVDESQYISDRNLTSQLKPMTPDDSMFITGISTGKQNKKYYIVNYKLNIMSLQVWRFIKSWEFSKYLIDGNQKTYKIYNSGFVGIYSSYNLPAIS